MRVNVGAGAADATIAAQPHRAALMAQGPLSEAIGGGSASLGAEWCCAHHGCCARSATEHAALATTAQLRRGMAAAAAAVIAMAAAPAAAAGRGGPACGLQTACGIRQ
eukprot:TRINITY_DN8197_c0_g2_i1.p2 TRINITY_DN8197_c0_g2~~TRINITY_DN8197_c0_g2_i1.p2  ORF type:complete len:108 (+),score=24.48 TRINITY_DN8197_c0_g2_i1:131-454(+)